MDMRNVKEFLTRRSTVWTLSLCMTGILVLGGMTAVDKARRANEEQMESELGEYAQLEEDGGEINDTLLDPMPEEQAETEDAAEVLGGEVLENTEETEAAAVSDTDTVTAEEEAAVETAAVASTGVISPETLMMEGIDFSGESPLLWPAAGSILIDYSMDRSTYFPTLNQYKYNPALVIGSEAGNQVLAAARGIVESVYVDEETGTTMIMNIGNGYKLTYGQLKELAVEQGDIVEEGAVIGYVSEPTKYYSKEGSNLYFAMTRGDEAVDPVQFLE